MPPVDQFVLALLGGLGFGWLLRRFSLTWAEFVVFMVIFWTLQTGPQYAYRWLDGASVSQEIVNVTLLRFVFVAAAAFIARARERA